MPNPDYRPPDVPEKQLPDWLREIFIKPKKEEPIFPRLPEKEKEAI